MRRLGTEEVIEAVLVVMTLIGPTLAVAAVIISSYILAAVLTGAAQ